MFIWKDIVFIHIPKCAGNSITQVFEEQGATTNIVHKHATYKEMSLNLDIIKHCLTFAVVRNPFDALVSHYCYLTQVEKRNYTFEEFIDRVTKEGVIRKRISEYIGEKTIILRFENLNEDFLNFKSKYAKDVGALPHLNKTEHEPYHAYYTKQTIALVSEYFKNDLETYGYAY